WVQHKSRVALLAHLAVHFEPEVDVGKIGKLGGRLEGGRYRSRAVESLRQLPGQPFLFQVALQVAGREVDAQRNGVEVGVGKLLLDVAAVFADAEHQLQLVVDISGEIGVEKGLPALHERRFGFKENDGCGRRFVLQLGNMVGIIAADADNFHGRQGRGRAQGRQAGKKKLDTPRKRRGFRRPAPSFVVWAAAASSGTPGTNLALVAGCATVPITGRRTLSLVPESEMNSLAVTQYKETLGTAKLSTNAAEVAQVRRVGQRIQAAVEQYFRQQGQSDQLAGYAWEFNLIDDPKTVNAWCMPGGKVAVYTGILPLTRDDAGLAVAVGAGTQVGLLKFSRNQESEADHLGLIFMAMAGYNPATAIPFWQRMAAQSQGSTPEFLSDHPADATRIAD
nr:mitochondrial metalloendopeptidase OMA1 [Tanacetum cinerariifolium]